MKKPSKKKTRKPAPFGDLAVGVRLGKPEPLFITCLINLLINGLRKNDIVLRPTYDMAAHKAANHLTRQFLETSADTLLLLDDDMVFPPHAAEALRSKKDNWPYDIVSALATTRTLPPAPILMKLAEEQPEEPYSRQGEIYTKQFDWEEGVTEPVDTSGLAFTLIRRHVLEAMTEDAPEFSYYFHYGTGRESEDIPFYRNAKKLGYQAAVDTALPIRHITKIALGIEEFLAWKETSELQLSKRNATR